jgi:hypothetical protein
VYDVGKSHVIFCSMVTVWDVGNDVELGIYMAFAHIAVITSSQSCLVGKKDCRLGSRKERTG